ncbi:MAG: FmdB family zinc ribbon protein [Candidatus Zipacnadales bacterium]
MPLFEYSCQDCGATFELLALSRRSKLEHPQCPKCGNTRTVGLISTCAVQSPAKGKVLCNITTSRG